MLADLHISGLGSIREAQIGFAPGFNVITGETGAGKTMLLNALGLIAGARADSSFITYGHDRAEVQAVFEVQPEQIANLGFELEPEDGEVYVRRLIQESGKSRAYLQNTMVPSRQLSQLSEYTFTIHGQSQQLKLRSQSAQREVLDTFAGPGLASTLADYQRVLDAYNAAVGELQDLHRQDADNSERIEELQKITAEISAIDPQPQELERLQAEHSKLQAGTEISAALLEAHSLLSELETPEGLDMSALSQVHGALSQISGIAGHDPEYSGWETALTELAFQLTELSSDLISHRESLNTDPEHLAELNQRIADLQDLQRKYGETIEDVLEFHRKCDDELFGLLHADQKLEQLQARVDELSAQLHDLAAQIHDQRLAAGEKLATQMNVELQHLAMSGTEFGVSLERLETPTRHGMDEVSFNIRGGGMPWRNLARTASGGELSRIMLALELCLRSVDGPQTFIFDEIDAGVGGQAGVAIGARLAELAKHHQVIIVTHLPQVAAYANHHFVVQKAQDQGHTQVEHLNQQQRVAEIARMLAGDDESNVAHAHAVELIERAGMRT